MFDLVIADGSRELRMTLDLDPVLPNEATVLSYLSRGSLYEPDVSQALLRILRPGDTFIDVGANIGYFTVIASLLVGPSGRVAAFEPDPRNVKRLRRNLEINKLPNVTIVEAAATSHPGEITLFLNSDDSGGSALWDPALYPGNKRSQALERRVTVPSVTLQDAVGTLGMAMPRLVKIDAEGAEHAVLAGATALLRGQAVPFVIAELHPFGLARMGSSQLALRHHMATLGYETFVLLHDGSLPRLVPRETTLHAPAIPNLLFSTLSAVGQLWPEVMIDPSGRS